MQCKIIFKYINFHQVLTLQNLKKILREENLKYREV